MVGHSKWSKVKHIKGPLDVKRGASFSRLVKEITVAARIGGSGSSGNPRLRSVVEAARVANLPRKNIERPYTPLPDHTVTIAAGTTAKPVPKLHDTQNVYSDFDLPETIFGKLLA